MMSTVEDDRLQRTHDYAVRFHYFDSPFALQYPVWVRCCSEPSVRIIVLSALAILCYIVERLVTAKTEPVAAAESASGRRRVSVFAEELIK